MGAALFYEFILFSQIKKDALSCDTSSAGMIIGILWYYSCCCEENTYLYFRNWNAYTNFTTFWDTQNTLLSFFYISGNYQVHKEGKTKMKKKRRRRPIPSWQKSKQSSISL
jgi:hypothetical protein